MSTYNKQNPITKQNKITLLNPNLIQVNIPLNDKNWFKTALNFAQQNQQEIFILGAGANILISDDGFAGLVIKPKLTTINFNQINNQEVLVTAGAGTHFSDLIKTCFENNILGLEEFSGIPGTVGGAVFINLHFFKFLLSQFLVSATVINSQNQETLLVDQNWFNFGYNQSKLQDRIFYLVDATFKLKIANNLEVAYAQGRNHEMIRYRAWRYPTQNTCGSFFRNFHENEVTLEVNQKKMIFIAYYLDQLGFKGVLQVGKASVSHQHANMLVTQDGATSSELITLARTMQTQVFEKFNIMPKPECLLIGFANEPLLNN